jgi:hypothetical protein
VKIAGSDLHDLARRGVIGEATDEEAVQELPALATLLQRC